MASLLGIYQPTNKIQTITKENHGDELKDEAKVDDKRVILDSKTVMIYRDRKKPCKIKYEPKILEENIVKNELSTVKDCSLAVKKVVVHSRAYVKSTGTKKIDSLKKIDSARKIDLMKIESESTLCDICSKTFSNKYILKAHMKKPSGCSPKKDRLTKTSVTCATCGQDKSASRILKHERLCQMSEDERAAYNATRKVECEKCHKILSHRQKLVRHIKTVHNERKEFQCEHCEHQDNRSDNMKTHMKNNHSEYVLK